MEDVIEVKANNEQSYANCVWQNESIDYTITYIDLKKLKTLHVQYDYDYFEIEADQIIEYMYVLKELKNTFSDIMNLVHHKNEIFKILEEYYANLL